MCQKCKRNLFISTLLLTLLVFITAFVLNKETFLAKASENLSDENSPSGFFAEDLNNSGSSDKRVYKNLGQNMLTDGSQGFTGIHYIENANYFLANPLHHANDLSDNSQGTCTTVALQLLVGYHNYYSDRRLIPQTSKDGTVLLESDFGDLNGFPAINSTPSKDNNGLGNGKIGTAKGVYERIFAETFLASFPGLGQALPHVTNATKDFLEEDSPVDNWSLENGSYDRTQVLGELDAGRPVILGFDFAQLHSAHVVVAYGYATYNNELCYITHYGWYDDTVQMLVPESWLGFQVIMHVDHLHQYKVMENFNATYRVLQCAECGCTVLSGRDLPTLFDGGTGELHDPFLISNAEQFKNIGLACREVYVPEQGNEKQITYAFRLTRNIEIEDDWTPFMYKFSGDFDGDGYYITYHMQLTQEDLDASTRQGLFKYVVGGHIHDLQLMNCSITSDTNTTLNEIGDDIDIGAVAGSISSSQKLENVIVTNLKIECKIYNASIGAFAGSFHSTFATNCVVRGQNMTSYITNNTHGFLGGMAGMGEFLSLFSGCSVTIDLTNTEFDEDRDLMGEVISNSNENPADYGITANVNMDKGSCIAEGSLITLADGSQKPVEALTGDEMLLVWNLQTGRFDVAPILFIDKDSLQKFTVISLCFSNGQTADVISEHGFWDLNLNKYVYLDKNADQYIGHWFFSQKTDENGNLISDCAQLTKVMVHTEFKTTYSPVTYGHLCYFVNGMLSMPGGIDGLFNIFDVDPTTMRYDSVSMQKDLEQYGTFTYEEFSDMLPVSKEVFEAFNGRWLKVAIGKGMIDEQRLTELVARYTKYFADM